MMSINIGVDDDGFFCDTIEMKASSFQEYLNRDPIPEIAKLQVRKEREAQEMEEKKANEPIDPRLQFFIDRFSALANRQNRG